jgi:hypothetical protein
MYVLISSTTYVWTIFHSKKNWARYDQGNILVFRSSALHSGLSLTKFESSRQFFENTQVSNFMEIHPVGAELFNADRRRKGRTDWRMDGGTDRHDEAESLFAILWTRLKISQPRRKLDTDVPKTVLDVTTDLYPSRLFGKQLFSRCVRKKYNSQIARVWCTGKYLLIMPLCLMHETDCLKGRVMLHN